MSQPAPRTSRAERTRAALLAAAEALFAERGFDATRLEDVAEAVGIRRASIVYHFRDKRELYDAVLEAVLADFRPPLERALAGPGALRARIEAAVGAWVDFLAARPAFARLLLREVADATPEHPPPLMERVAPFTELVERLRAQVAADPREPAIPVDPVHLTAAVVGTSVFFLAAMPALAPGFDPLGAEERAAHKREVLRITRRLLGAARAGPPASAESRP